MYSAKEAKQKSEEYQYLVGAPFEVHGAWRITHVIPYPLTHDATILTTFQNDLYRHDSVDGAMALSSVQLKYKAVVAYFDKYANGLHHLSIDRYLETVYKRLE